jgi:hypothetical protein
MKQILHIFVKDVRRFWPEIFIVLALVAVPVSIYSYLLAVSPQFWQGITNANANGKLLGLLVVLTLLNPFGWWLLISRVFHAENLVGDTQFWITRPYEWKKLLTAKLLFLVSFVYLPVLMAYCILLAEKGFPPQNDITTLHGLLQRLLLMTGIVVLPLTAIATVTSNFARMVLSALGAFLCMILAFVLPSAIGGGRDLGPNSGHICFALILVGCGTVVVLQYAWRKTWFSRLLLLAIPVLVFAVVFIRL